MRLPSEVDPGNPVLHRVRRNRTGYCSATGLSLFLLQDQNVSGLAQVPDPTPIVRMASPVPAAVCRPRAYDTHHNDGRPLLAHRHE
jgi:hypothetical protein